MSAPASDPGYTPVLAEVTCQRRFPTLRAVSALILREMATTYGRSPIGYLWAVLQPAISIFVITFVFTLIMRTPPLGTNFVIFYASGFVPYTMYRTINTSLSASIQFSKSLLSYPSVTFVDALLGRFVLGFLTQLLVAYVLFSGITLIYDTRTIVDLPAIALSFFMCGVLAFGIGTMNCFLIGVFPAWQRIWSIANRPMVIISGVIFLYDTMPQPYRDWLWWNPLVHIIGQMRKGFYPYYDAPYVTPLYPLLLGLVLTVMGLMFLRRYALFILND
jgi:capsular polysaccharide transport system permease protein